MLKGLYRFDEFALDPGLRTVTRNGTPVPLSPKTFQVLMYLVANPRRVVTKDEIIEAVWSESFVEENNLSQHISWLRKAFGDRSGCIVTIPGQGYQFGTEVLVQNAEKQLPRDGATNGTGYQTGTLIAERVRERNHTVIEETSVESSPAPRVEVRPRYSRRARMLIAAAALGLVAAGTWRARVAWQQEHSPRLGNHHQIVLADFENATGDPAFDSVFNTALAIDLKQSPYLQVTSDRQARSTMKLMERAPDETLSPSLALEVCQRTGDQAVVSGTLTRFGQMYLVTLSAVACGTGIDLAQSKATANGREGVLHAMDSAAAELRVHLGESLPSVEHFRPLLAKRTPSLDALRAYSLGSGLASQGKYQEAIPLMQRATELDPKFAIAYADLGMIYSNLYEHDLSVANLKTAYEQRDSADERDSLYIVAAYNSEVTGDLHGSIRNYETWTQMYPQDYVPWADLADRLTQMGQAESAIEPAKKSVELDPRQSVAYVILARALLRSGHIREAKAICREAIARKVDPPTIHGLLMQAAVVDHDGMAINQQIAWSKGKPDEGYFLLQQVLMDFSDGKSHAALATLDRLVSDYRHQGLAERADRVSGNIPRIETELGLTEAARKLLRSLPPIDGSTDIPVALAENGETAAAEAQLQRDRQEFPSDTLWQDVRIPQMTAAIALSERHPDRAIDALRIGVPYDLRNFDLLAMRGRAYLDAKLPALAEAEYRRIIAHPGVEPFSVNRALSHVGLARAYAMQHQFDNSRKQYEEFFAIWKDADPDLPILKQARAEYSNLPSTGKLHL